MMLADVSAHQPRTSAVQKPQYHYPHPHQQPPPPPPHPRATTPVIKQELTREQSPEFAPPAIPLVLSSQAAYSSPIKNTQPAVDLTQEVSHPEPNGTAPAKEAEAPAKTTPRLSTHRIMDILNDDQEVPVSRARESQPPAQEPSTPFMREASTHQQTPSRSDALRVDAMVTKHSWTPSVAVLVIQHHHRLQTLFLGNNRVFRRHHNHHPQGNLTKRCVAETRYRRFESCWTGRPANLADSHQIGLIMEIMEQRGYHPLGTHILTLPRLPRSDLK
jgi:hypothetical protein